MTFNSLQFALFLPLVIGLYWWRPKFQNPLLLAASYFFYGYWDPRFLLLIAASTVIDYSVARGIDASDDDRRRKSLLMISLIANLGILGIFKYFNFFADSLDEALEGLGAGGFKPSLDIILPVGISFYTFQTMSYTIDVYRRRLGAEMSLLNVAVYVAFFPQLVAGPIERATHFMPQVTSDRSFPVPDKWVEGIGLIALGIFKKVVLADAVAPIVQRAFADPGSQSSLTLLLALYGFAIQIYADFSGYSDVARGTSMLLGFDLLENFRQPYLSRNITMFWRTWHISLSNWLRDYLYITLGGNRGGTARTYRNLFLTMLLGGLWHGSSWNFVIWGALHGFYLAFERAFRKLDDRPADVMPGIRDIPNVLLTFHLVCFAWIFFRASTFTEAADYIRGFTNLGFDFDIGDVTIILAAISVSLFLDFAQRHAKAHVPMMNWRPIPLGAALGSGITAIILFSGGASVPFLYFQF